MNDECVELVGVCETIVEEVETDDADSVVVVVRMVCVELTVMLVMVVAVAVRVRVVEERLASRPQTRLQSVPHQGSASPTSLHSTTHSLLQAEDVVVEVSVMLLLVSDVADIVMLVLVVELVVLVTEVVCVTDVVVNVMPQATPQASPQRWAEYCSTQKV